MGEKTEEKISAASSVGDPSHSFVVDMKPFSHFIKSNSRIVFDSCYLYNDKTSCLRGIYQENDRSGIEKRSSPAPATTHTSMLATTHGTKAASTLHGGGSTPEKPSPLAVGPSDHSHHQITITTTNGTTSASGAGGGGVATAKRLSFRRTTIDPRRILLFFATLSSMGTILLIYFTLSMGELNSRE